MPFIQTYAVDFANGNRLPYLDLGHWGGLTLPVAPTNDALGLILTLTRPLGATDPVLDSVFVVLPTAGGVLADAQVPSVPLHTRLFMRVEFDLPLAGDLPVLSHETRHAARRTGQPGPSPSGVESPGILSPPHGGVSVNTSPEPWAVVLNVSPGPSLPDKGMVSVACQFTRRFDGVRLNTPGSVQTDQAANLESPLDYGLYQGGPGDPPLFTLEHSFCGWNFAPSEPASGAGSLKITRTSTTNVTHVTQDHRVYSSRALALASSPASRVGALGISLATLTGVGRISVRLRTFSVWFNPGLETNYLTE